MYVVYSPNGGKNGITLSVKQIEQILGGFALGKMPEPLTIECTAMEAAIAFGSNWEEKMPWYFSSGKRLEWVGARWIIGAYGILACPKPDGMSISLELCFDGPIENNPRGDDEEGNG